MTTSDSRFIILKMRHEATTQSLISKSENFDWQLHKKFLTKSRFRPLFDRAFGHTLRNEAQNFFDPSIDVKPLFISRFDKWANSSKLNQIQGLEALPNRDFIIGVTHALDDLHISFSQQLVGFEKCYPYHRRMKNDFILRNLDSLQQGDVLIFEAPFAWHGAKHPLTDQVLDRCLQLNIPVHIDSAWFGCVRDFSFNYNHPAIQSVSFSLSKSLGLGSHRVGVRYSKIRHAGPVTLINDFSMEITSVMAAGIKMMDTFGSDYLQNRYGEAYQLVCEKLNLRPTNAIHTAFEEVEPGIWHPVGIRSFLRYLVDDYNEFK
jgi:hypothetical protein